MDRNKLEKSISTDNFSQSRVARSNKNIVQPFKMTYVQNLEKMLDDVLLAKEQKKEARMTRSKNISNTAERNVEGKRPSSNMVVTVPNLANKPHKTRICRVYFKCNKMCKNGDNCKFAHHINEITTSYKPKEWVETIKQSSKLTNTHHLLSSSSAFQTTSKFSMGNIKSAYNTLYQERAETAGNSTRAKFFYDIGPPPVTNINKVINTKGRSLLLEAAATNNVEASIELVKQGASVSQRDWNGMNSLLYAIKHNSFALVEGLLQNSLDVIDLDEKFTVNQYTYLIYASKIPNYRIIQLFLEYKADPNICDKDGRGPLYHCIEKRCTNGINLLCKYGVELNKMDNMNKTILDHALSDDKVEIVDILIRNGASLADAAKNRMLILYVSANNLKNSLNELIKRGINLNEVDSKGNNLLTVAYDNGHLELVEYLISEYNLTAQINQINKKGDNLVLKALKDQNDHLIRLLLNNLSVDLSVRDKAGKTLLIVAAETGNFKIIDVLLGKKVDPNAVDKYGHTALISACKGNHIMAVESLLRCELNVTWKDYIDNCALDYTKNETIQQMLKNYLEEHSQFEYFEQIKQKIQSS